MKLQKAGVNFLVSSLTNAPAAVILLSSKVYKSPSTQSPLCFYLPPTAEPEQEEWLGLIPVQSWILHINLERFCRRAGILSHLHSKLV